MLRLVVTVLALSAAWAQQHSICFSNDQGHTEDEVIGRLADMADRNRDGIIKEGEVVVTVANILGVTFPLSESIILGMNYQFLLSLARFFNFHIDKRTFVQTWHQQFHDSEEFIGSMFDGFDVNGDGKWSIQEVDRIIQLIVATSDDGDKVISRAEFVHFFESLYKNPDCE